jgi:glutamine amidotransferase
MKIAVIDYGAGNVFSVVKACQRCGITPVVTSDISVLEKSDKIIFPGVGHAATALKFLKQHHIFDFIKNCKKPFLGICLGMQLLGSDLEEAGELGLNIIPQRVKKFLPGKLIPHIGWNSLSSCRGLLFLKVNPETDFYFVHSYYMEPGGHTSAYCQYEEEAISAAVEKENFFGVQFHPEKSGPAGEQILKNFFYRV